MQSEMQASSAATEPASLTVLESVRELRSPETDESLKIPMLATQKTNESAVARDGPNFGPEGSSMSMYEYSAGHRVRVCTASRSGPATTEEFVVMRRHSVEGGESMYTLSHSRDGRQRMTPASELTQSGERAGQF